MNSLITVSHTISMGHRLPSYNGVCSSMHGHNVRVVVSARVREGFLDFKQISAWLRSLLDPLDHAMVLYEKDPMVTVLQDKSIIPYAQRIVRLSVEPTTEALAQLLMNEMVTYCFVESVTVHETDRYSATCTQVQPHDLALVKDSDYVRRTLQDRRLV